jgi:RNA polymerase sigma-70 factor (ECF subfamily)
MVIADAGTFPSEFVASPTSSPNAVAMRAEPRTFDEVYDGHADFVWRVLRGMGVGEAGLEDAVQDVFVVVYKRLATFDGKNPIRTWLFAIAHRVACDHRRKGKRAHNLAPLDERLVDGGATPAEATERNESARILLSLLEELDDDKRATLILAELEGMTAPEIAAATGAPVNTVYTRLRRARADLNRALMRRQRSTR